MRDTVKDLDILKVSKERGVSFSIPCDGFVIARIVQVGSSETMSSASLRDCSDLSQGIHSTQDKCRPAVGGERGGVNNQVSVI